ncbi:MAG: phosphate-starvation-inducible PsiE family protein [Gammaproteobacteria bacterium]|nr:phosphate-starvation-inducible PsiE family protein [Gammaproteobacteria bacterium]MDJ0871880.1 phosphate-starvation-inducible PsiE family protein [Gammaproteobacteria bacterium]
MISVEFRKKVLEVVEQTGLALILVSTVIAIGQEVWVIVEKRHVDLADLLLLFIYMEVVAMVGIYFESHSLPVRFPLYIAMVALARYLILDSKDMQWSTLIGIGAVILILALAILVVRFGHVRFPYNE